MFEIYVLIEVIYWFMQNNLKRHVYRMEGVQLLHCSKNNSFAIHI